METMKLKVNRDEKRSKMSKSAKQFPMRIILEPVDRVKRKFTDTFTITCLSKKYIRFKWIISW